MLWSTFNHSHILYVCMMCNQLLWLYSSFNHSHMFAWCTISCYGKPQTMMSLLSNWSGKVGIWMLLAECSESISLNHTAHIKKCPDSIVGKQQRSQAFLIYSYIISTAIGTWHSDSVLQSQHNRFSLFTNGDLFLEFLPFDVVDSCWTDFQYMLILTGKIPEITS